MYLWTDLVVIHKIMQLKKRAYFLETTWFIQKRINIVLSHLSKDISVEDKMKFCNAPVFGAVGV